MSASVWCEVRWLDHTESTNPDVAEEARRGGAGGLVVVTLEQRAGRGRMDRTWVAPPGISLVFSTLLEPRPELPQRGRLSLLVGMAAYMAVGGLATEPGWVQFKWPNDVLIDGRKACGILSERVEHQDGVWVVTGIDINASIGEDQFPVPTVTFLRIVGFHEDPRELPELVLEHFQPLYERWQGAGEARGEYQRCRASTEAPLQIVIDVQRIAEEIGHGVDEYGRLRMATASGIETFAIGDVIHTRLAR